MKTFKFEVTIREGNDEFWEELKDKSGCDEVLEILKNALAQYGFLTPDVYEHADCEIKLLEYKDE